MKRRKFIQTIAVSPAIALPVTAAVPKPEPVQQGAQATAVKYELSVADTESQGVTRFFTRAQYEALNKLCGILMPAIGNLPGALDCGVPEFLDFLIGKSPADRKQIYTSGLDILNAQARRRFSASFADLDEGKASELLAPLKQAWTYNPPADPLSNFLRNAKQDVRNATLNSREYIAAGSANGRRGGGLGQYWYPID